MPFDSVFAETSDVLLFDNIMAAVKDNMKPALDEKFPPDGDLPDGLPDFAQRVLGNHYKLGSYPVFALDPDEHGPQQSADGSWIEDAVKIQTFISVFAENVPDAYRLAAKYVTAYKAVLRNAERDGSFMAGIAAAFALFLEFSYKYGVVGRAKFGELDGYELPVNFELLLKFNQI